METIPQGTARKFKLLGRTISGPLSEKEFVSTVVWLEEEKIRLYSQAQRARLRTTNDRSVWLEAFHQYCTDLGLPASCLQQLHSTFDNQSSHLRFSLLDRLASLAVQDFYKDKLEASEIIFKSPARTETSAQALDASEFIPQVNAMLRTLSLPTLPSDAVDQDVADAVECIRMRVENIDCKQTHNPDLSLPLGFEPAPELRNVCVILRLLHGQELRKLQDHQNKVVAELQHITANPKTDSRLGQVGR